MTDRQLLIAQQDFDRLTQLIRDHRGDHSDYLHLKQLDGELKKARIVEPQDMPPDVVTMNSTVTIRASGSRQKLTYTIVYPEHADLDEDRISVLAPIGTALLGYRVSDEVQWNVPAGRRSFQIEKLLFQPEAAGQFDH